MVGYAYYGDGTATATTGSNVVIGQNTGWLSQIGTLTPIKAGDKFGIHVGNPIIIASIDSDTQITLEDVWPGPDQTDAPYKIELTNPSVIAIEAVRQLLASLSNGVLASLSTVPLDVDKIPIGIGPGVFGLIDKLALTQGVNYDVLVDTLTDRDAYDGQSEGYSVLVADNGDGRAALYVKNSNTSGDWSDPAYITGPVGSEGVQQRGNYSAVTAYEIDDLVQYGGSTWIAKVATTGNVPPTLPTVENAQWLLFARSGTAGVVDRGTYSAATAYVENDIVLDNGSTWIAIAPTTGNAPPTLPTESNAYWRLLARKGTDGSGTGDVVGPTGGVLDGDISAFNGTTGKIIKLAEAPTGTLLGRSSSGTGKIERLTPAQARQVLGGWEQIGNEIDLAALSFTAWTNLSAFKQIRMRAFGVSGGGNSLSIRVSSDNGASWFSGSTDYAYAVMNRIAASVSAVAETTANSFALTNGSIQNNRFSVEVELLGFNKAGAHVVKADSVYYNASTQSIRALIDGYANTGINNALQLISFPGAFSSGSAILEGIRG